MKEFAVLPRIRLANLPTPLQELPILSKALKGPRIFVKRDDLTGLAWGGNKARKLEYLMAEALRSKANYIVTGAGFQSNWCTQTASAARKLGMKIVLVKRGPKEGYDPEEYDGNHLLHFLQGAEMKVVKPEDAENVKQDIMENLREAGHRPYLLPVGGSSPIGVAGYINAILELLQQAIELDLNIAYLIHATGSAGTQSGLIIGTKVFNTGIKIIGATTGSYPKNEQTVKVSTLIEESLRFLNLNLKITEDDVIIFDQYATGYGFVNEGKVEALRLLPETEGLFLDPVYTGTAMACLIDLCKQGFFKSDDVVVFLHTGGLAGLFPYKSPLKEYALRGTFPWKVPPWSPLATMSA